MSLLTLSFPRWNEGSAGIRKPEALRRRRLRPHGTGTPARHSTTAFAVADATPCATLTG
ncbi:hypothetical protein JDN40_14205 [Rhodomicrobium vannielii ATCC 17100]|uniref:Uncharacterized protein n=1 Tax=Rhodomicrobium udaipurense TaxID=1202716 RepID=A0A8I1GAJ3_9HYPH|nr:MULTISPECIES: hypothetical protein [Rhodomicrobium]MBJ7535263.1 hypothetical protein [Rhodomicrobium vannielii ATCC 17100]MBJ7543542.1 hypothetical protein [Rhodomicrobium udaipurense]